MSENSGDEAESNRRAAGNEQLLSLADDYRDFVYSTKDDKHGEYFVSFG